MPSNNRLVPGGGGVRHTGPQPGVSYTPGAGMGIPRQPGGTGNKVDDLRRQLAQLTADLAMAQANGKSPRHIAEIQGRIYKLQLEIQIAQEQQAGTADWLGDMTRVAASHSRRMYEPEMGGGG